MSASQKQALRPCSAALEKKKEALLKSSKKKKSAKIGIHEMLLSKIE